MYVNENIIIEVKREAYDFLSICAGNLSMYEKKRSIVYISLSYLIHNSKRLTSH